MAYAGQILSNPVSGETIEFVETAADTDGELLAIDLTLTPDGHVPGTHVHPEQAEPFEVRSGKTKFKLWRDAADVVSVTASPDLQTPIHQARARSRPTTRLRRRPCRHASA